MRRIPIVLVIAAISCITMLSGCEKDPPTVERKPDTLTYLKSFDIYDIEEHTCTVVTSTDRYEYTTNSSGYYDFLTPPLEQIDSMSTMGLIETVLENPIWIESVYTGEFWIWRFLSTTDEIYGRFEKFNPGLLDKLYGREDAASLLKERYVNMYTTCSENNYFSLFNNGIYPPGQVMSPTSVAFLEIQCLIAEDPILYDLTRDELREVSLHIIKTYISVMETTGYEYPYYFSINGAAWLAVRIMEINDYQPFNELWGELHSIYRTAVGKFMLDRFRITQLMICFNDFIQEEL